MDCEDIKRIKMPQDNVQWPDFDISHAEELIDGLFNMGFIMYLL
jgi:hypothetical protein